MSNYDFNGMSWNQYKKLREGGRFNDYQRDIDAINIDEYDKDEETRRKYREYVEAISNPNQQKNVVDSYLNQDVNPQGYKSSPQYIQNNLIGNSAQSMHNLDLLERQYNAEKDNSIINPLQQKIDAGRTLTPDEEVDYSKAQSNKAQLENDGLRSLMLERQKYKDDLDNVRMSGKDHAYINHMSKELEGKLVDVEGRIQKFTGWDDNTMRDQMYYSDRVADRDKTESNAEKFAINDTDSKGTKLMKGLYNTGYSLTHNGFLSNASAMANDISERNNRPEGFGANIDALEHRAVNNSNNAVGQVNNQLGKGGQFLYGAAYSGVDSLVKRIPAMLLSAAGIPSAVSEVVSLAPYWVQSYNSGYEDARNRGASDSDAKTAGIASGTIEALTEVVPVGNAVGNVLGKNAAKSFVKTAISQGLAEATEEFVGTYANELVDNYIFSDDPEVQSNWENRLKEASVDENGRPRSEAETYGRAIKSLVLESLENAASGFISSPLSTGVSVAIGSNTNKSNQANISANAEKVSNSIKGTSEYETSTREQAERYKQNPMQAYADQVDDRTDRGKEIKSELQSLADKQDRGETLTAQERYYAESLMAESNEMDEKQAKKDKKSLKVKENIDYSEVPTEYRSAISNITEDEAHTALNEAATNGDVAKMGEVYQNMKNSNSQALRENADDIFSMYSGKAQSNGVSKETIDGAKISKQDAYIMGLKSAYIDDVMLSDSAKEAYNNAQIRVTEATNNRDRVIQEKVLSLPSEASKTAYQNIITERDNPYQFNTAWDHMYTAGRNGLDFEKALNNKDNRFLKTVFSEKTLKAMFDEGAAQTLREEGNKNTNELFKAVGFNKKAGIFEDIRANKDSDVDFEAYRALASYTGQNIVIADTESYDFVEGENARFVANNGQIVINADASVAQGLHEALGEFTEFYNSEGFEVLSKSLNQVAYDVLGADRYKEIVGNYAKTYRQVGERGTDIEMSREMTNDMLVSMMSTDKGRNKLAEILAQNEQSQGIVGKIKDIFHKISKSIKSILDASHLSRMQREVLEKGAKELESNVNLFAEVFAKARENAINMKNSQNDNSVKETNGVKAYKVSYTQMNNNLHKVHDMESIGNIEYNHVLQATDSLTDNAKAIQEYVDAQAWGNGVENKDLGLVKFDTAGFKDVLSHKEIELKMGIIDIIPEVLKHGEVVAARENHKNRVNKRGKGYNTVAIAAKVNMIGEAIGNNKPGEYYAAVVVRRDHSSEGSKQRLHVIDILTFKKEVSIDKASVTDGNLLAYAEKLPLKEILAHVANDINIYPDNNIEKSYSLDVDSEGNKLTENQQKFFKDSKVRDENGALKPVYHGTGRADRVGYIFDPERATSGPMAFFTDSEQIATNYSRDKADTSISRDSRYDSYYTQFRMNIDGKDMSIGEAWDELPARKRAEIRQKAPHITFDDDYENIIYDESKNTGLGNFDKYLLAEHKNNYLEALVDAWLEQGDLYNDEARFQEVLSLVGIDDVEYLDPDFRDEKVYGVYLNITNPFNTKENYNNEFIDGLEKWWSKQEQSKYITEDYAADMWDKTSISVEQWIKKARNDMEDGTTHAWAVIPDAVTDYLKETGHDGIEDIGGKNGGDGHTVYIPFASNQIKEITNENPTQENNDIRYSLEVDSNGKKLTENQVEYFDGTKVVDEKGRLIPMYHGSNYKFTVFDSKKFGLNSGDKLAGIWTSSDKGMAYQYGDNIVEGYVKITNPISMDSQEISKDKWLDFFNKISETDIVDYNGNPSKNARIIDNLMRNNDSDYDILNEFSNLTDDIEAFYKFVGDNLGVDGYVFDNRGTTIAVAFSSEQIKNIDNTNPTTNKDIRYSLDVDSEGNELTKKQKQYFSRSKMVDELGRLKVYFHGTEKGGFTVFDPTKSDDGVSLFFTDNIDVAKSYSGRNNVISPARGQSAPKRAMNYGVYLNIENPLVVNAKGKQWNRLPSVKNANKITVKYNTYHELEVYANGETKVMDYEQLVDSFGEKIADKAWNLTEGEEKTFLRKNLSTRDYALYAYNNGYDGVVFNDMVDMGWFKHDKKVASQVAIVFNAEQIKSINNENPTSSNDIRYSLSVDEAPTVDVDSEEIKNINNNIYKILQDGLKALSIGSAKVDKAKVNSIAEKVIKDSNSAYLVEDLSSNLEKVFAYMQKENYADPKEIMSIVSDIVRPVIEQSANAEGIEDYKKFRNFMGKYNIKLNQNQIKAVEDVFDSYDNYKIAMMPLSINTKGGNSLVDVWEEMSNEYGALIPMGTAEEDMPLVLSDALNAMKPTTANNFGADQEELAKAISMDIVAEFLGGEAKPQMQKESSKYKAEVKKEYTKRKEKAGNDKYAEYVARNKERAQRAKEREKVVQYKKNIAQNASKLIKWIDSPTKEKHVPKNMVAPIVSFLHGLNFIEPGVKKTEDGMYSIRIYSGNFEVTAEGTRKYDYDTLIGASRQEVIDKFYKYIDNGGGSNSTRTWKDRMSLIREYYDKVNADNLSEESRDIQEFVAKLSPNLAEDFKYLLSHGNNNINQLNSDELRIISNVVNNIIKAVNQGNKAYTMNAQISVDGDAIIEQSNKVNYKQYGALMQKVKDLLKLDMLSPRTYFSLLGDTAMKYYKQIREGQNIEISDTRKAANFMENLKNDLDISKKDIKSWTGADGTYNEIKLSDGSVMRMTYMQMMSLYESSKRSEFYDRIGKNGIRVADFTLKNGKQVKQDRAYRITKTDVDNIKKLLSDKQLKFADALQRYMAIECAKDGNEVTMQMYGYDMFIEENYFPFKSDPKTIAVTDANIQQAGLNMIKNSSFTKARVEGASNPLIMSDILDVYTMHVAGMAKFHGYTASTTDLLRLLNYKQENHASVQRAIDKLTNSDNGSRYISDMLLTINGASKNGNKPNEVSRAVISHAKAASVLANLSVVVQQPTAYFRAMNTVDLKYLLTVNPAKAMKNLKTMGDESAISWWKSQGYYETSIGKSLKGIITGSESFRDEFNEKAGFLAGKADDITWAFLYTAIENEQRAKHRGENLSNEEFRKLVNERFDDVVDQTQVVDTLIHKSKYMRADDGLSQLQTAFMAEPTKSYNMLIEAMALDMHDSKGGKATVKRTARAITAFAVSGIASALAKSLITAFRHKKKYDEYWDVYKEDFIGEVIGNLNPLNLIPWVKDISNAIESKLLDSYSGNPSRTDLDSILGFIDNMEKLFTKSDQYTPYGMMMLVLQPLSQVTGLPMYALIRDTVAIGSIPFGGVPDNKIKSTNDKVKDYILHNDGDINALIDEYIASGKDASGIKSALTTTFKPQYEEALVSGDDEQANNIKERIASTKAIIDEKTGKELKAGFNSFYDYEISNIEKEWTPDEFKSEEVKAEEAKKEAEKAEKEAKKESYNDLYEATSSNDGSAARKAISDLIKQDVEPGDIKSNISTHYHTMWKNTNDASEKAKIKKEWINLTSLVNNVGNVENPKDPTKTWEEWEKKQ